MGYDKERQDLYRKRWVDNRIAQYLAEHGDAPLCQCGCGGRVNFSQANGKPFRYLYNHHTGQNSGEAVRKSWELRHARTNAVPKDDFKVLCYVLRHVYRCDWSGVADLFGMDVHRLRTLLHDKRAKAVGRERFDSFLSALLLPAFTGERCPPDVNECRWLVSRFGYSWSQAEKLVP